MSEVTCPMLCRDLGSIDHHVHLAGSERLVVVGMDLLDLFFHDFIAPASRRRGSGLVSPIGTRGDLNAN